MQGINFKPMLSPVSSTMDRAVEVAIQRENYIVVKNDLIQMTTNECSQRELKLLAYCFSKVKPVDVELPIIETTLYELCQVLAFGTGTPAYTETDKALNHLTEIGYSFKSSTGRIIHSTPWFKEVLIDEDKHVTITLNPILAHYLIVDNQEGHYTKFMLGDAVEISGRYALNLFMLIKSFENLGGLEATPQEVMRYFGREEMTWSLFRNNYLKRAVAELNKKQSFYGKEVVVHTIKKNNRVHKVQLRLEELPEITDFNTSEEMPDIPLFNWLED